MTNHTKATQTGGVPSIFTQEGIANAHRETQRLSQELDIANADHVALWLEANLGDASLGWLAVRIVEAHETALAKPTPPASVSGGVPSREAVVEAVHRAIVRWTNGEQPDRIAVLVTDAVMPLFPASPSPSGEEVERLTFAAGFHAAERALGFEGCDESEEALDIEWQEYFATLSGTTEAPDEQ